jgi:cytochrome c553
MKKTALLSCMVIIVGLTITGCEYNKDVVPPPGNTCDTTGIVFSVDIRNIFDLHGCYSCHTPPAANGGVNLATHAGVSQVATDGRLIRALNWTGPVHTRMPQGGVKLSDCEIARVAAWIREGQKNN